MKKIDKMVLNQISKKELTQRQMGRVKGGRGNCTCGCCGSSSVEANGDANCSGNQYSSKICEGGEVVICA